MRPRSLTLEPWKLTLELWRLTLERKKWPLRMGSDLRKACQNFKGVIQDFLASYIPNRPIPLIQILSKSNLVRQFLQRNQDTDLDAPELEKKHCSVYSAAVVWDWKSP
jgi:hypothetical protein